MVGQPTGTTTISGSVAEPLKEFGLAGTRLEAAPVVLSYGHFDAIRNCLRLGARAPLARVRHLTGHEIILACFKASLR